MPSPFPGMDPYLEDPELWSDVHHNLISEIQNLLNKQLRPKYYVRIEERVYIADAVTTIPEGEVHEAFLKVIDRQSRAVVTVIEVLSPANKVPGSRGLASFEQKRLEVLNSSSHRVEIDLLRDGISLPARQKLPTPCEYLVHVSKVEQRPRGLIWPIRLSQRLPVIPIPLKPEDPDAPLDLQDVLNTAYDRAGYDLEIDYRAEPVPPLSGELACWAEEWLRSKGLRPTEPGAGAD